MDFITNSSCKILTILRCCSSQYQPSQTNSFLLWKTDVITNVLHTAYTKNIQSKNSSSTSSMGLNSSQELSREDCIPSVLLHLRASVCLNSSGVFTKKEAMFKEAPEVLAHCEYLPDSQVNSTQVFWDYSQRMIQANVCKAACRLSSQTCLSETTSALAATWLLWTEMAQNNSKGLILISDNDLKLWSCQISYL